MIDIPKQFEDLNLSDKIHAETKERLQELARRLNTKENKDEESSYENSIKKAINKAETKFKEFKNIAKDGITDENIDSLAKLTDGVSQGLYGEAQKIYRTEMVARINDYLATDESQADKNAASKLLEKGMAAMKYNVGDAKKALYDAMRMVQKEDIIPNSVKNIFLNKYKREALAKDMEKGQDSVTITDRILKLGSGDKQKEIYIENFEVLTGSAMTKINPELLNSFVLKNVIEKDGVILAQMENGCQGNFVVIKPGVKPTPKPEPEKIPEKEKYIQHFEYFDLLENGEIDTAQSDQSVDWNNANSGAKKKTDGQYTPLKIYAAGQQVAEIPNPAATGSITIQDLKKFVKPNSTFNVDDEYVLKTSAKSADYANDKMTYHFEVVVGFLQEEKKEPEIPLIDDPNLYSAVRPSEYTGHALHLSTNRGQIETSIGATEAIEQGFKEASVDGIITALQRIPQNLRIEALNTFFAKLKNEKPLEAKETEIALSRLFGTELAQFKNSLRQQFTDLENGATEPQEKALWNSEGILFDFYNGNFENLSAGNQMNKIRKAFKGIDKIHTIDPNLQSVVIEAKKSLQRNIRQSTALDLLENARETLNKTFTDSEGLKEFLAKTEKEKTRDLGSLIQDYDEEVFFSSMNVYDALVFLVETQYTKDLMKGAKKPDNNLFSKAEQKALQKNPIKYYYDHLDEYKNLIEKNNCISSIPGRGNVRFANYKEEIRLFNEYQNGEEQMGDTNLWNVWDGIGGNKNAFMYKESVLKDKNGDFTNFKKENFIERTKDIFDSKLLEDTGNSESDLGLVEKARLAEIQNLNRLGNYGELRQMVMNLATNSKFKRPTEKEVKDETKKIENTSEGGRLKAQIELQVDRDIEGLITNNPNIQDEDQALRFVEQILGIPANSIPNIHAYYGLLVEDTLEGIARQNLFFRKNINMDQNGLSQFDKSLANVIEDINNNWNMGIEQETIDKGVSHAKTIGELIAASAVVYATGGMAAGVMGAGEVTAGATVAANAARGATAVGSGTAWGTAGNVTANLSRSGLALMNSGSRIHRLGYALGRNTLGRSAIVRSSTSRLGNLLAPGKTTLLARTGAATGRLGLQSAAFLETQKLLHSGDNWAGELVSGEHTKQALMELGTMMATFGMLGGVQKFMRGGTTLPGLQNTSQTVARFMPRNTVAANAIEGVVEVGVFTGLGMAEQEYLLRLMMEDKEFRAQARSWDEMMAESAIIVGGLRTWRKVNDMTLPKEPNLRVSKEMIKIEREINALMKETGYPLKERNDFMIKMAEGKHHELFPKLKVKDQFGKKLKDLLYNHAVEYNGAISSETGAQNYASSRKQKKPPQEKEYTKKSIKKEPNYPEHKNQKLEEFQTSTTINLSEGQARTLLNKKDQPIFTVGRRGENVEIIVKGKIEKTLKEGESYSTKSDGQKIDITNKENGDVVITKEPAGKLKDRVKDKFRRKSETEKELGEIKKKRDKILDDMERDINKGTKKLEELREAEKQALKNPEEGHESNLRILNKKIKEQKDLIKEIEQKYLNKLEKLENPTSSSDSKEKKHPRDKLPQLRRKKVQTDQMEIGEIKIVENLGKRKTELNYQGSTIATITKKGKIIKVERFDKKESFSLENGIDTRTQYFYNGEIFRFKNIDGKLSIERLPNYASLQNGDRINFKGQDGKIKTSIKIVEKNSRTTIIEQSINGEKYKEITQTKSAIEDLIIGANNISIEKANS